MKNLLDDFKHASIERKRFRRIIIKTLRENRAFFYEQNYQWLIRKMNGGYMGDLSDPRLMRYLEQLIDRETTLQANERVNSESFTFDERNIVV